MSKHRNNYDIRKAKFNTKELPLIFFGDKKTFKRLKRDKRLMKQIKLELSGIESDDKVIYYKDLI